MVGGPNMEQNPVAAAPAGEAASADEPRFCSRRVVSLGAALLVHPVRAT